MDQGSWARCTRAEGVKNQGRVVKAINTRNEMTRLRSRAPRITELRVGGRMEYGRSVR